MNRKEEIDKNAHEHFAHGWQGSLIDAYIEGAEWADEHPKKGLADIEKVKEFLSSVDLNFYREWEDRFNTDELIIDLERYLEE